MPTTIRIEPQTRRICAPCKHHKCVGMLHIRTGGGYREYVCEHPQAFEPTEDVVLAQLNAHNLAMDEGRYIGKTEQQPDWCPLNRDGESK